MNKARGARCSLGLSKALPTSIGSNGALLALPRFLARSDEDPATYTTRSSRFALRVTKPAADNLVPNYFP